MAEFAANGATHLVLTEKLIGEIMEEFGYAEKLDREMKEAGLVFGDAHAPFGEMLDLDAPIPELRPQMIDRLRLTLDIVGSFGVPTCTIHVGNTTGAHRGYSLEYLHNCIAEALEALLPVAEHNKVAIAIENIWFPTNTPEKLLDLIGRFPSPYLGICYDSGHANLMARDRGVGDSAPIQGWEGRGPIQYDDRVLEKLLPHLVTCHLHDNYGIWDDHNLPGDGEIDWSHVMGLLKQAPRLLAIQNEASVPRGEATIASTCRCYEKLMKL